MDKLLALTMRILDGPDWQLQSARGQVVFMNFFATWCGPCVMETPTLVAYASDLPKNTTFIAVDVGEDDNTVRRWRKKFTVCNRIAMDQNQGFFTNIGMKVFPTTLIIGPDGRLACAHVGTMSADDLAAEHAYALATSGGASDSAPSSIPVPSPTAIAPLTPAV